MNRACLWAVGCSSGGSRAERDNVSSGALKKEIVQKVTHSSMLRRCWPGRKVGKAFQADESLGRNHRDFYAHMAYQGCMWLWGGAEDKGV